MYCPEGVYEFTGLDWTTGPIKNDCVNTTLRADTYI